MTRGEGLFYPPFLALIPKCYRLDCYGGGKISQITTNMAGTKKSGRTPEQQAARDARKAAKRAAEAEAEGEVAAEVAVAAEVDEPLPSPAKRKRGDDDNGDLLEIDLSAATPLSKAEARAARKKAKRGDVDEDDDKPKAEKAEKKPKPPTKQNSIWIGNLSFRTTAESLKEFLENGVVELGGEADSVTRVNLPKKKGGHGSFAENKGWVGWKSN